MKPEVMQAVAVLTAELLRRPPTDKMEATTEVIASAFEAAYLGVLDGLQRIGRGEPRQRPGAGDA